ncbi:MAG: M23 family metallopeptidase [Bryobacteraceae bacterium]|jgi:murein DD-endopeptidase MepM/ murein hydrolase activator NlpD
MKQEYFVVVLAHSMRGRLRRIHIPYQAVYAVLVLALLGSFSLFGFVASYARMVWKVGNYNALRRDADNLRGRYDNLQKKVSETDHQLATLEMYAEEVSVAYGIKQKLEGPADISAEGALIPSFPESLQDYNFLRSADLMSLKHNAARRFQPVLSRPAAWPLEGRIIGAYGIRLDPFSSEGATEFHKGVDIGAPIGTSIKVTADGLVLEAGPTTGGYGRLVVVDHGGGYQTYYAHLSRVFVQVGQEVSRGETVGAVGMSGRVTAPHLHYEVRRSGIAINPYTFMKQGSKLETAAKKDFPF